MHDPDNAAVEYKPVIDATQWEALSVGERLETLRLAIEAFWAEQEHILKEFERELTSMKAANQEWFGEASTLCGEIQKRLLELDKQSSLIRMVALRQIEPSAAGSH